MILHRRPSFNATRFKCNSSSLLNVALFIFLGAACAVTAANAQVSLSSNSLLFPSEAVGKKSPPQTVTLTNTGSASLSIKSITLSNSNFQQSNNCPVSLGPSGNCSITVTFAPQSSGHQIGSVSIIDNAVDSPQSISVADSTAVVLSTSKLNFGTQQVGATGAPLNITLTNSSSTAITITSFKFTGADKGDFAQINDCGALPASIAGGASCIISATFAPGASGSRSGNLSIGDTSGGSQSISLSGAGAILAAGTLQVTISGLPSGTKAYVTVYGPDGYNSGTLTATTSLSNLSLGTYNVVGTIVPSSTATNTVYVPSVTGRYVIVSETGGAEASVAYYICGNPCRPLLFPLLAHRQPSLISKKVCLR